MTDLVPVLRGSGPLADLSITGAVAAGGGGGDYWTTLTADVMAAQILTLHSQPIILVPAPGAGKFVWVAEAVVIYKFGTTIFDNNSGGAATIEYGTSGKSYYNASPPPGLLYTTSQSQLAAGSSLIQAGSNFSDFENKDLRIWDDTADCDDSNGDGLIHCTIRYVIYDLP